MHAILVVMLNKFLELSRLQAIAFEKKNHLLKKN
jgi:hypothetical protein